MELNDYVVRFIRIMRDLEELDLFPASANFSKTEFRILREIIYENNRGKNIISSELARRIGVTRSAISQIVNKMEKQGVIERVPAPDDKKIAYVRLSRNTLGVYEEQYKQACACLQRIVEIYGKEKMEKFISSCNELTEVFKQVKKETGGKAD